MEHASLWRIHVKFESNSKRQSGTNSRYIGQQRNVRSDSKANRNEKQPVTKIQYQQAEKIRRVRYK